MAKSPKANQQETDKPAKENDQRKPRHKRSDGTRETIESIVVAFILAFLFRTFEAEAFVIPTGSMAPTLYGRHIEFVCSKCGTNSVVGASSELDRNSNFYVPRNRIASAVCPNCHYENPVFDVKRRGTAVGLPAFRGDRILVNKFPYEFWEPERWDVVVFKYPEDPKTNYIKRLVGLPGEEIQIEWGDVYVRKDLDAPFGIARKKDPNKQKKLQIPVYDNDRPARDLYKWGWPERWAALRKKQQNESLWVDDPNGWNANYQDRTFEIDAKNTDVEHWIRYRHIVPTADDWNKLENGAALGHQPKPTLITDFCFYNAYTVGHGEEIGRDDVYWVGDLTLDLEVEIRRPDGALLLELVRGGYKYRCRFDLKTGEVTLFYIDEVEEPEPPREEHVLATATTALNHAGRFEISFANVDQRLCLWIDHKLIDFGAKNEYDRPDLRGPVLNDLAPVGVAAQRSNVKVSHLVLRRDIYYRADAFPSPQTQYEYGGNLPNEHDKLRQYLHDPQQWATEYIADRRSARFEKLGPDEFFMMGDNSPHSQDSRLWPNTRGAEHRHAVPRTALVGKAFFVYWPHGVPFMNGGRGFGIPVPPIKQFTYEQIAPGKYPEDLNPPEMPYPKFSVPFYPNIFRMHRIR
jgi:signal peptidase I